MKSEKFEYIKEEIATYREIVKLIVIIILAISGGIINIIINIINKKFEIYTLIFSLVGFVIMILLFLMLKYYWNKLYEFKGKLKDYNE